MKWSLRAIELCRLKYGKGSFYGFEKIDNSFLDNISEESVERDYDELMQNGIIANLEGDIHISALGQHIFRMLHEPEQFILLDNAATNVCVRLYIRNAFYLCVLEDKKVASFDSYDRYLAELLPRIDLVVGSFIHALHCDETRIFEDTDKKMGEDIRIIGQSWNESREIVSTIMIDGNYRGKNVSYQTTEIKDNTETNTEKNERKISELINDLILWTFKGISATMRIEV